MTNEPKVNDVDIQEIGIEEAIAEAKTTGNWLNTKTIIETKTKKAKVTKVLKAYKRRFVDAESGDEKWIPYLDIEVQVETEGPLKGKPMTFSLNKSNLIKMSDLFGKSDQWIGKMIRFTVVKLNSGKDTVAIDSD
jgi:hypothetical protein